KAGNEDVSSQQVVATVNASSFTVKFATPTCNLSVSPTTIDFGDVGNDKPRKTFTLKNSNCVNASGVTLKLTSTKAAYDNSGLSILANTTTGTSAAGGRGVAVSYEGSSRQYLSANDTNSSVSIDFGSIVTAKDITMAGLLTCTSASNNSTCDDYTPGAFTAAGTISATYK
ncbi:pilus assembly protein FimA, partial [Citrobacter freundii]